MRQAPARWTPQVAQTEEDDDVGWSWSAPKAPKRGVKSDGTVVGANDDEKGRPSGEGGQ
jgi:hypothetical protein